MVEESYWSKFAEDFEEKNNYVVGLNDMEIIKNKIVKEVDLGNTLELACGNGTYSKLLVNNSTKLTATDYSKEMISVASNKFGSISNIIFEKANCFNLHYPDNSFDTVFMANLLHVISDPITALLESKRVLKSGGKIIILDLGMEGVHFINKVKMIYRYLKTYGKPPKTTYKLTVKTIEQMLTSNEFLVEHSELIGQNSKAAFVKGVKLK